MGKGKALLSMREGQIEEIVARNGEREVEVQKSE
jgi:hypothetical protein